jgi:hypothetical protein
MEPREPELKDFEPVSGPEEKPERWWVRYLSYILICPLMSGLAALAVFFCASGAYPRYGSWFLFRDLYLNHPVWYRRMVMRATAVAAIVAFLVTAAFCVKVERDILQGKKF